MGSRPSSFKQSGAVVATSEAVKPTREWSSQQAAIFDWFREGYPRGGNLVVRARAGTGKTTTIIEGINRAPETDIMLTAFNKRIADELNNRIINPHATAKTMHAIGYQAIRAAWGYIKVEDRARGQYLTEQAVPKNTPKAMVNLITRIHTRAREGYGSVDISPNDILQLMIQFDMMPDEAWVEWSPERVAGAAFTAMQFAADEQTPPRHIGIDYADMIFLPLVKGWLHPRHDLVVIDEGQDFTGAQLEIALRICSGRVCIVGDDRQAIYGFRGADTGSLDRLKARLNAIELPLTVTYRCGRRIVEYVKTLVPDYEAGPNNPEGEIVNANPTRLYELAQPGHFILSRLNAPLVSYTLAFLRRGIRARMAGRDIGKGLAVLIESKLKCGRASSVREMLERLQAHVRKTTANLAAYGRDDKIQQLQDTADTIEALASEHETVGQVLDACAYLFEDEKRDDTIVLSTVHKAKGLEADKVFILQDTLYRRPDSRQNREEQNIEVVAVTRAKTTLTWVSEQYDH